MESYITEARRQREVCEDFLSANPTQHSCTILRSNNMGEGNGWSKIPWDGNHALGYECWRKRFGRGHVSVGCGDSLTISHSFGANGDGSFSSTRWRPDRVLTEQEAMDLVDAKYNKQKGETV